MLGTVDLGVARDASGRILVHEFLGRPEIQVFDSDGRFLRALGRRGQGPLEFLAIGAIDFSPTGRLYVFDEGSRRATVLSASLELLTSFSLPLGAGYGPVVPSDEVVVLASPGASRETVGYPIHVVDSTSNGALLRSFGSDGLQVPGERKRFNIGLATSGDAVWAVERHGERQEFRRWSLEGELTKELTRSPGGWYSDEIDRMSTEFGEYPDLPAARPNNRSLYEDRNGYLWLFTFVADRRLKSLISESPDGSRTISGTAADRIDTVIEVIDIEAAAVVSRRRIDQAAVAISEGFLFTVLEIGDRINVEVLEVNLLGAPERR